MTDQPEPRDLVLHLDETTPAHPGHTVAGGTMWHSGPRAGCDAPGCEAGDDAGQPRCDTSIDTAQQVAEHHTDGALQRRLARVLGDCRTLILSVQAAAVLAELAPELAAAEARASAATRVQREISRLAQLPTVTDDDGRADSFATGARWAIRQIHNALDGQQATP